MTAEQRLLQQSIAAMHGYELARLIGENLSAAQLVRGNLRRVCRFITDPELAEVYRQRIEDGYAAGKAACSR